MANNKKESEAIYRIMDFSRVVQIFEKQELYFAHPSTWDDPYETRLHHKHSHSLFAQCWSQSAVSDAMWRIYSQHGTGVRISTTKSKLREAVRKWGKSKGYRFRGNEVSYFPQNEINKRMSDIQSDLADSFHLSRAVDILYLKREAFEHENEWRATVFCPDTSDEPEEKRKGISIKIDPHKFISSILLDPRAPIELVNAFTYYFTEKLEFSGTVRRSALYKSPHPLLVDEGFE